jgi:hypothetical protein
VSTGSVSDHALQPEHTRSVRARAARSIERLTVSSSRPRTASEGGTLVSRSVTAKAVALMVASSCSTSVRNCSFSSRRCSAFASTVLMRSWRKSRRLVEDAVPDDHADREPRNTAARRRGGSES